MHWDLICYPYEMKEKTRRITFPLSQFTAMINWAHNINSKWIDEIASLSNVAIKIRIAEEFP